MKILTNEGVLNCFKSSLAFCLEFKTCTDSFTPIRMHFAINSNNDEQVKLLIDQKLDLNFYAFGNTPLMLSLLRGNLGVALNLVKAGANLAIGEKFKWQRKPIHLAANIGDLGLVREIITRCRSCVHSADAMLFTPLHWAAVKGHLDVVKFLVESDAHVNVRDDRGRTPLHRASDNDHLGVVSYLIQEGGAVNLPDNFGWTPIYQSIVCAELDVVQCLLENGASVNVRDIYGMTPLIVACDRKIPRNLKVLQKTSTDFYTRDYRACTDAVQRAMSISGNDLALVESLLDFGADVNAVGGEGKTSLRIAAEGGATELVRILVSAGADLNLDAWILSGEWPPGILGDAEFCIWLRNEASSQTLSLMRLCKIVIRKSIGKKIQEKISELPIPTALQLYLFVTL